MLIHYNILLQYKFLFNRKLLKENMTPESLLSPDERNRLFFKREKGIDINVYQSPDGSVVIRYGNDDFHDPFAQPKIDDDNHTWA